MLDDGGTSVDSSVARDVLVFTRVCVGAGEGKTIAVAVAARVLSNDTKGGTFAPKVAPVFSGACVGVGEGNVSVAETEPEALGKDPEMGTSVLEYAPVLVVCDIVGVSSTRVKEKLKPGSVLIKGSCVGVGGGS